MVTNKILNAIPLLLKLLYTCKKLAAVSFINKLLIWLIELNKVAIHDVIDPVSIVPWSLEEEFSTQSYSLVAEN